MKRTTKTLGALALAALLAAPTYSFAHDRPHGDDERSVFDELEETLKKLPRRIEEALGDVKKELDPERARELKRRLERTLENLKEAIDPRAEKVRVRVGDRSMEVPARKGSARLY